MPASASDPVDAALRATFSGGATALSQKLANHVKHSLLAEVHFEPAGTFHSCVVDALKAKYVVLKASQATPNDGPGGGGGAAAAAATAGRVVAVATPLSSATGGAAPSSDGTDDSDAPTGAATLKLPRCELFPLGNVQLGWGKKEWTVGAGLINMGNTCYLNSTLQALFHVPAFVNWLIADKEFTGQCQDAGGLCIICAMKKTLQDCQHTPSPIRPLLIYNKLRLVCRNLIPGRQEDAHEFLRHLVEAMEKAYLNRFKNRIELDAKIKETTPLNQILGGYLRSAVRCLKCGHISTTFQHFQDLLLDIRKAQAVDDALEGYFCREKLDEESYHCESCKKKVPATKQFSVERPPMVLCIQLKRFSISNSKITKHLHFRQRLDLTKYARYSPSVPLIYRLAAVVTHMGPTVNCGHYTAVAQTSTGTFYQFDDNSVRIIPQQTVFNTNAYIMFYELETSPFNLKPSSEARPQLGDDAPSSESLSNGTAFPVTPKVYGPELPPGRKQNNCEPAMVNNNSVSPNKSSKTPSASLETLATTNTTATTTTATPTTIRCVMRNGTSVLKSVLNGNVNSKTFPSETNANTPTANGNSSTSSKLVPYEVEDSNSSDDSQKSGTSGTTNNIVEQHTDGGCKQRALVSNSENETVTWNNTKKCNNNNNSQVVSELQKMSHNGYAIPVSTWNGQESQMSREVSAERNSMTRKRPYTTCGDSKKTKHIKVNELDIKSNPGYNPIQEYSSRNWNHNYNRRRKQFHFGRNKFHPKRSQNGFGFRRQ